MWDINFFCLVWWLLCFGGRIWLFLRRLCLVLWDCWCFSGVKVGLLRGLLLKIGWEVLYVILLGCWYMKWEVFWLLVRDLLIDLLLFVYVVIFFVKVCWVRGELDWKEVVRRLWILLLDVFCCFGCMGVVKYWDLCYKLGLKFVGF